MALTRNIHLLSFLDNEQKKKLASTMIAHLDLDSYTILCAIKRLNPIIENKSRESESIKKLIGSSNYNIVNVALDVILANKLI